MTMKVLAVTGGMSDGSASVHLATEIARAAAEAMGGAATEVVSLRPYARDIADAMVTGFPSPHLEELFTKVEQADAIVAVTPIYNALPSGLFISFFDVLPEDVLRSKPVALGATGGSPRHSLIIEHSMRPLMVYLHAVVPTTAVYAATEDWGAPGVGFDATAGQTLAQRIQREGAELAMLLLLESHAPLHAREADAPEGTRTGVDGDRNEAVSQAEATRSKPEKVNPSELEDATKYFPDFVDFEKLMK